MSLAAEPSSEGRLPIQKAVSYLLVCELFVFSKDPAVKKKREKQGPRVDQINVTKANLTLLRLLVKQLSCSRRNVPGPPGGVGAAAGQLPPITCFPVCGHFHKSAGGRGRRQIQHIVKITKCSVPKGNVG